MAGKLSGTLPYRQVHLDFHTSNDIENIGTQFSKKQFVEALREAHVSSVTVFSKCHHGYSYHPSDTNLMHPHLRFDLLKEQLDSLHEANIRTCVYISAGFDERQAVSHPQWWTRDSDGKNLNTPNDSDAGYHLLCFNTEYLDVLVSQVDEVAMKYPCAGFFLDISNVVFCKCAKCRKDMLERNMDIDSYSDLKAFQEDVYLKYTNIINSTIRKRQPNATIFHNAGHIPKGNKRIYSEQTHFELESLPTGGWGYDHFPMSATWATTTNIEYLGMTGKFHKSWGEFGGYKHENALIYETALSVAFGAKCSVGDQLHPLGIMDKETYRLIGKAYERVEQIEDYVKNAKNIADIGVLSYEGIAKDVYSPFGQAGTISDVGCVRMLLECHYLFHVIDGDCDFKKYSLIILPDRIRIDENLRDKLDVYIKNGGKIFATGQSLLDENSNFMMDTGCKFIGREEYKPLYCGIDENIVSQNAADYIFYSSSYKVDGSGEIGNIKYPYFNRTKEHFCSHLHAPCSNQTSSKLLTHNVERTIYYMPLDIFEEYAVVGSNYCRQLVRYVIDSLMTSSVETNLPSQAVVTCMQNEQTKLLHLLYASPIKRGNGIEVIEDIVTLNGIEVKFRADKKIKSVTLLPQCNEIKFEQDAFIVKFVVEKLWCHQLISIE